MLNKQLYPYFFFGTAYRYLQDARDGYYLKGRGGVLDNIQSVLNSLEELELFVSKGVAEKTDGLVAFRNRHQGVTDDSTLLSDTEASEISRLMDELRSTVTSELKLRSVFVVTEKRYEVTKLLNSVKSLMPVGAFDLLPDIARYDFEQAGRCLAFELPTAAAFHLLRGTEEVLRQMYLSRIQRKRLVRHKQMWDPMVKELKEASPRKRPPQSLLNNLDNIRVSYRNPTQHPEMIYDMNEAQNLFGLCNSAVGEMLSVIHKQ